MLPFPMSELDWNQRIESDCVMRNLAGATLLNKEAVMRRTMRWIFIGLMLGMGGWLQASACPVDALATDSALWHVIGVGSVAVEVCVTRVGAVDTYTYRFTVLGAGTTSICSVLLSGAGAFATLGVAGPPGWLATTDDPADSCATWWTWTSTGDPGLAGPGGSIELTLSVEGETYPTPTRMTIKTCDGNLFYGEILGPAACGGLDSAGRLGGCRCTASGCLSDPAFVGSGTRIEVLGGADLQRLDRCEDAWIRHGWSGGSAFDPDSVEFRLFIDGIPVALDRQVLCGPSYESGRTSQSAIYFVQFPADAFLVGLHEVTGEWILHPTPADPEGYTYSRTIRLLVEECPPAPIPLEGPPFGPLYPEVPGDPEEKAACPDLVIESVEADCACSWNQQQQYVCRAEFEITVKNTGGADAETFRIKVESPEADIVKTVPSLAAGATRVVKTNLSFEGDACPLTYAILVDFYDELAECDEENNRYEDKVCCQ